jgi:hypothetical protein
LHIINISHYFVRGSSKTLKFLVIMPISIKNKYTIWWYLSLYYHLKVLLYNQVNRVKNDYIFLLNCSLTWRPQMSAWRKIHTITTQYPAYSLNVSNTWRILDAQDRICNLHRHYFYHIWGDKIKKYEMVIHVTHLTETRSKFTSLRRRWKTKPRPIYKRILDKSSVLK